MRTETELLLEFLSFGIEMLTRRDCALVLLCGRESIHERRIGALLDRLRQEQLIQRHGRGRTATFVITDEGRKRITTTDPNAQWNRPWDGNWRVFAFDMPASHRKERMLLWRALRDRRFGLLQQSVWIWPHNTEPILKEIINDTGIPECFCGFEANRIFLCDNAEIVASAWDFEAIAKHHRAYIDHPSATPANLKRASDLGELARLARVERAAFRDALWLDPLLPRELWPKAYQGLVLWERHQQFRLHLTRRLRELTSA